MVNRACGIISTNYSREDFSLLTVNRPIASIPFGARYRLVDFPLSNMVNSKITSVGLITPHLYRSIIDHVGSGKEWGLSIKSGGLFILPGTTYGFDIGKGKIFLRDIKNNSQFLTKTREEYVVLSASNKIYNIDYNEALDFHIKNGASVTLIYKKMEVESVGDMSIDLNGDKVVGIGPAKKKMSNLFIDTLIMDKEIIFKLLSWYADRSYLDLIDVINENLSHLKVYAYEFKGYVAPINNLEDYMKASRDLFKQDVMKELLFGERRILTKIHDAPPVKYGENAKVSSSIIGTGTKVLGEVKNSIIFRASIIEEDVKLNNCVIMQGAVIKKGAKLTNVILEKYAIVGEGADYHGSEKKPLIITRMQN